MDIDWSELDTPEEVEDYIHDAMTIFCNAERIAFYARRMKLDRQATLLRLAPKSCDCCANANLAAVELLWPEER